uniref:Uncharacterized protein n=1 Tax=Aplanochytrium stocchinoi TaxID=215587 RepID=A0A7S3PR66_9STRA
MNIIHKCNAPVKTFNVKFAYFAADCLEITVVLRLVITGSLFYELYSGDHINIRAIIPFASAGLFVYIIFHNKFEPAPLYIWVLNKLTWTCREGCNPISANTTKERKVRRKLIRDALAATQFDAMINGGLTLKEVAKREMDILAKFDVTKFKRYESFFDNVKTLTQLDDWEHQTAKADQDI